MTTLEKTRRPNHEMARDVLPPIPPNPGRQPRAFVLCRVSPKEQGASGSLPLQAELNTAHAASMGLPLVQLKGNTGVNGVWYDCGVSAWKTPLFRRQGFLGIWSKIKKGDVIIMLSLDRGWRSVQDFLLTYQELLKHGVEVAFPHGGLGFGGENDSPMTRFLVTGQANIAELKSELISERVRESAYERKMRALSCEGSLDQCVSAAESGTVEGHKVKPIKYEKDESVSAWGDAYQKLKELRPDTPRKTGRVFGYVRVSSSDQSITEQKASVDRYITEKFTSSEEWVTTFVDHGISAFRTPWAKRPEGRRMWDALQPGDQVVILAADRAFRSLLDMSNCMQELENKGVTLHFIRDQISTDTANGMKLLQALSMAAQWESDDSSRRIKLSRESNRQRWGIWSGPHKARWVQIIRCPKTKIITIIPDDKDIERMITVTEMVRNKGKLTYSGLTRAIEAELAERDGRRPVQIHGESLNGYRKKCDAGQRLELKSMIQRKIPTWQPIKSYEGFELRRRDEIFPEVGRRAVQLWESRAWKSLLDYVSVKPEIFGEIRERVLELG